MTRLATGLAALLLAAGCSSPNGSGTPTPPGSPLGVTQGVADDAVLGLCDAIAALPEDPDGSSAAFLDRAHQPIHQLAAALQDGDTSLAATLLIAKQAVEADLGLGPPSLEHLQALLRATQGAVHELGLDVPDCPSSPPGG